MKSDIEIAQEAKLIRIDELAHSAGLSDDEFEPYGRDKAKVSFHKDRQPHGKLILVTDNLRHARRLRQNHHVHQPSLKVSNAWAKKPWWLCVNRPLDLALA